MRRITAKMRRLSHTPEANRKRRAAHRRIIAFRLAHGIPMGKALTKQQKKAAHEHSWKDAVAEGPITRGSVPIGDLDRRQKPKPGAQAEARRYLTSKRVDLAADVTALVKKLEPSLAAQFLHVLKALLNGAH